MKKYIFTILAFCFACSANAQSLQQKMQHIVDSVYEKNPSAIGFMIYVESPNQKLSWSYAVGYADKQTHQKLQPTQPVLIASNTKPYVSAAILRLVEQGKITINDPIAKLLTPKTVKILTDAGYNLQSITLKHLLSHTSGIRDYVDEGYFKFITEHKQHAWTRDEQIARAASLGKPLFEPGKDFKYADINYVLLTEIIEQLTSKPFYKSMRALLDYKGLHLNETWFAKFENPPSKILPAAHQYWDEFGWNISDLDPSWDLYGGGGMMATTKDVALFFQYLFNGKVIHNKKILDLMTEDVPPNLEINYCLGIRKIKYAGVPVYNHGGGLGTDVIYIPQLNTTIAIAALEAGHRPIALEISKAIVQLLSQWKF